MKNKSVGLLIIGIAIVIGLIIFMFNQAMTSIVTTSCSHGPICPMYGTIKTQTYSSLGVALLIFIIGLFIFFSKPEQKTIIKKEKKKKINLQGLDEKEKRVIKLLQEERGVVFQSTLMEKISMGKVGMTRLLDKLESKQIIERKRRGMNNIIVLKN